MASSLYPAGLPTPLQSLFKNIPYKERPFQGCSTGNYRGHIAVYEIRENALYLNKIYGACDERLYTMPEVFGDTVNNEPVMARWFTGFLQISSYPEKELEFEHQGRKFYNTTYKKIVLLEISEGLVIGEFEYEPYIYSELHARHQFLLDIPDEQKEILDRLRSYDEALYGEKFVKQQERRREKLRKKLAKNPTYFDN